MAARYYLLNAGSNVLREQRPRPNPLEELTEVAFVSEYRLFKSDVRLLAFLLRSELGGRGSRICDITLEEKRLVALKCLASGSFQNSAQNALNVSQPTVSRCLNNFVEALCRKAGQFIYMPSTPAEREQTKHKFYDIAGFPGVLDCVDGTHIPIIAPTIDEYAYVNRKNFHSINVQAVCDADMVYLDVVARWPGSHHDSFIMSTSALCNQFERGLHGDGWLLGDSGYGLRRWLMTPINSPKTREERHYNEVHRRTRCLVKRSFGVLKSRWRILDHTGGTLCYSPDKTAKIFIACSILHNICRRRRTPLVDGLLNIPPAVDNDDNDGHTEANLAEKNKDQESLH